MSYGEVVFVLGVLVLMGVLIYSFRRALEEKIDDVEASANARCTSLAMKLVEHKNYLDTELTRALTKSETAFQLAHQASVAVGKKSKARHFRVSFDPMKFTTRQVTKPRVGKQSAGNA